MEYGKTGRGIAIVTIVWVIASVAALALATTSNDSASAQQSGCTGGGSSGSPSASGSASPSASSSSSQGPIPSIPPSIPPAPAPDAEKAPKAPKAQGDTVPAGEPEPVEVAPLDPYEKVPVAAAQQRVTCKSTITIAYKSGRAAAFSGKVGSDEPMCKRARKVAVKKIKRGNDPTVGRGVTNARGSYRIAEANARGRYYAVVAKSSTENDDGESVTCQAARSRAIRA